MTFKFEVIGYQPAEGGEEQGILFQRPLDGNDVTLDGTVDLEIDSGVLDDMRPFLFAIRLIEGNPANLTRAVFVFTFLERLQAASPGEQRSSLAGQEPATGVPELRVQTTKSIEFNPAVVFAGTSGEWQPFEVTVNQAAEITRVQVRWGPVPAPRE